MINPKHFRELIIRPVLEKLELHSPAAETLLLGTAIKESGLRHLIQIDGDDAPYDDAIGVYQVEVKTYYDLFENYLNYRPDLRLKVLDFAGRGEGAIPHPSNMAGNLYYATAIARIVYKRIPVALPAEDDLRGLAGYWKLYYNTAGGAGTERQFIEDYQRAVD